MKKYWFYGIMPEDSIPEKELTQEQLTIIETQKSKLTKENLYNGWLGFFKNDGWYFMRNGFPEIFINESKGNIARKNFQKMLPEIYKL